MPRTRSKSSTIKARATYREYEDSSEEDCTNEDSPLRVILGLLMPKKAPKRKRTSTGRSSKRRTSEGGCESHCHCCHHKKAAPKKSCGSTKGENKRRKATAASTSTVKGETVITDSDDEEVNTDLNQAHTDDIKSKMDNFFKQLESEDDTDEDLKKKPSTKPDKDFYTIPSDSEEEKEKKEEKISTNSLSEASTSGLRSVIDSGLKMATNNVNFSFEKKTKDLFAYVDDILNECSTVVDITNDKPKENVPVLSLADLKKKTDEILGGVASLIEDIKPKEPEKKVSSEKEATICPICLEELGGGRQAMATLCGHIFCQSCIQEVVKTTRKCPTCRKGLTKTKYHPVYL